MFQTMKDNKRDTYVFFLNIFICFCLKHDILLHLSNVDNSARLCFYLLFKKKLLFVPFAPNSRNGHCVSSCLLRKWF